MTVVFFNGLIDNKGYVITMLAIAWQLLREKQYEDWLCWNGRHGHWHD